MSNLVMHLVGRRWPAEGYSFAEAGAAIGYERSSAHHIAAGATIDDDGLRMIRTLARDDALARHLPRATLAAIRPGDVMLFLEGPAVRARMLQLHPRTYQKLLRLRIEADQEGAYRVAKRIHAVVLNADGRNSSEVAEILKAPRSKVSEWLANYETYGVDGLLEGYRNGRPACLDYHPGHVRKLLHGLGFSVQRPHRVLARADPAKQDRWHRRTYPNLKKNAGQRLGVDLHR